MAKFSKVFSILHTICSSVIKIPIIGNKRRYFATLSGGEKSIFLVQNGMFSNLKNELWKKSFVDLSTKCFRFQMFSSPFTRFGNDVTPFAVFHDTLEAQ